jgi:hypothetical protein
VLEDVVFVLATTVSSSFDERIYMAWLSEPARIKTEINTKKPKQSETENKSGRESHKDGWRGRWMYQSIHGELNYLEP